MLLRLLCNRKGTKNVRGIVALLKVTTEVRWWAMDRARQGIPDVNIKVIPLDSECIYCRHDKHIPYRKYGPGSVPLELLNIDADVIIYTPFIPWYWLKGTSSQTLFTTSRREWGMIKGRVRAVLIHDEFMGPSHFSLYWSPKSRACYSNTFKIHHGGCIWHVSCCTTTYLPNPPHHPYNFFYCLICPPLPAFGSGYPRVQ